MGGATITLMSYPNNQKAQVAMKATAKLSFRPLRPMVVVYGVNLMAASDRKGLM